MLDDHTWCALGDEERGALARVFGDGAETAFDGRPEPERVTLRSVRLAMAREHAGEDLWSEVERVLWVSPNQVGLAVRDAERFYELVRDATRADGEPTFRADPRWLVRYFKHGAEWSLRETGAAEWGLQLYRRGHSRQCDGEIVADLDRAALTGGVVAHLVDVLRPAREGSDPRVCWASRISRSEPGAPATGSPVRASAGRRS